MQYHMGKSVCNIIWEIVYAISYGKLCMQYHMGNSVCNIIWEIVYAISYGK